MYPASSNDQRSLGILQNSPRLSKLPRRQRSAIKVPDTLLEEARQYIDLPKEKFVTLEDWKTIEQNNTDNTMNSNNWRYAERETESKTKKR